MTSVRACKNVIEKIRNLDENLTRLTGLAASNKKEDFESAIIEFSRNLDKMKLSIKEFFVTYKVPTLSLDYDENKVRMEFEERTTEGLSITSKHESTLHSASFRILVDFLGQMPKHIKADSRLKLRSGQVATMLGVSRQQISRYVKKGIIPRDAVEELPSGHRRFIKSKIEELKLKRWK